LIYRQLLRLDGPAGDLGQDGGDLPAGEGVRAAQLVGGEPVPSGVTQDQGGAVADVGEIDEGEFDVE
jgi:hypothetical protein